jgi:hypothetical protein
MGGGLSRDPALDSIRNNPHLSCSLRCGRASRLKALGSRLKELEPRE